MAIAAYNSSGTGHTSALSSAAQSALEKGRETKAAKATAGTEGSSRTTTSPASSTQRAEGAAKTGAAASRAAPSSVVNISGAARAKLEAEKAGGTSPQGVAATGATPTNGRPQAVKFNSVDDAIAYGTRRANEQAAARQGLKPASSAQPTGAAASNNTEPAAQPAGNGKKGYVPELSADTKASIEKGRKEQAARVAAEQSAAKATEAARSAGSSPASATASSSTLRS